jgi:hypothetical protein
VNAPPPNLTGDCEGELVAYWMFVMEHIFEEISEANGNVKGDPRMVTITFRPCASGHRPIVHDCRAVNEFNTEIFMHRFMAHYEGSSLTLTEPVFIFISYCKAKKAAKHLAKLQKRSI